MKNANPAFSGRSLSVRRARMWKLSDLLAYEAELAGEPPPPPLPPEKEKFLTALQLRERYGGVSEMWFWRRLKEAEAMNHGRP